MTTFENLSPDCQVFVPRGIHQTSMNFTSEMKKADSQTSTFSRQDSYPSGSVTPMAVNMAQQNQLQSNSYGAGTHTPVHQLNYRQQQEPSYHQYAVHEHHSLHHGNSSPIASYAQPSFHQQASATSQNNYVSPHVYTTQATMSEIKMNFGEFSAQGSKASFLQRRVANNYARQYPQQQNMHQRRQPQFGGSQRNVYQTAPCYTTEMPSSLPLSKVHQFNVDASSPITKSTNISSHDSHCDDDDLESIIELEGFDSPVNGHLGHKQASVRMNNTAVKSPTCAMVKNENGWKKKVKTELCRFWLNGQQCENSQKDQGCGFAHGQEELQKKKGLSRQYLTSVCKNFLIDPSKCTYGQRCIFQHPTFDVRKRQRYTAMMRDNARYTAMRLFQDIEGSEVIYINTYAASTPRLTAFRGICSSAKDNGEDLVDEEESGPIATAMSPTEQANFSRDLFRASAPQQQF